MSYEIKEHEIAPVMVMSIRVIVPFSDIASSMDKAFDNLYGYLTWAKAKFSGAPFSLYHAERCDETQLDMEICAPVEDYVPETEDIKGRVVDGAKNLMLRYIHKGPYEDLGKVYPDMMRWADENGMAWDTDFPMREIYLNDPDRALPEELLTEIVWSVKKK